MRRLSAVRRGWHIAGLATCALLAFVAPQVQAQQPDIWGGSLSVTSDYRVRGISKTRGEAAIQGGLHAQFVPGWVVGAWGSTVSRDRGRNSAAEVDLHTGYAWNIAPDWDAKVVLTHYWYADDPAPVSYDYDEVSASLTFRSQFVATLVWSPNAKYFGRYRNRWYPQEGTSLSYELTGLQPLTASLSLTGGLGYNDLQNMFDAGYWYWNAGVSYTVGPVQLDVSRIDSDSTAEDLFGRTVTEAGWSAAISWRF